MLTIIGAVFSMVACFSDSDLCSEERNTHRAVWVVEVDEFPFLLPSGYDDTPPSLRVAVERLDTGELESSTVEMEKISDEQFELPGHDALLEGSYALFAAPNADDCTSSYDAEITLEMILPETWPLELREDFLPVTVWFAESETSYSSPDELVCLGSSETILWCVHVQSP